MPTNLDIDDKLVQQAMRIGKHRTRKEAVTAALKEYILSMKQEKVIALFGTIDYVDNYDHKKQRVKSKSISLKRSSAK